MAAAAMSGCVLNVLEYATPENADRIFDNSSTLPNTENNFTGFVQVGDNIPASKITPWMEQRCSEIAGGRYKVGTSWKGISGPHSTPHYYKCVPSPQLQMTTQPILVNPSIQPALGTSSPDSVSLTDSKTKCIQIGFTEGTEGFGKCVLQLTK